jgi:hypothetical protein
MHRIDNKIRNMLVICLLLVKNLFAMAAEPKSIILREFRTVTPTSQLHFVAVKGVFQHLARILSHKFAANLNSRLNANSCMGTFVPGWDPTQQGLILNFMRGIPHRMLTPWGSLVLLTYGKQDAEGMGQEFLQSLSTRPVSLSLAGNETTDDFYQVDAVDGLTLPNPVLFDWSQCGVSCEKALGGNATDRACVRMVWAALNAKLRDSGTDDCDLGCSLIPVVGDY